MAFPLRGFEESRIRLREWLLAFVTRYLACIEQYGNTPNIIYDAESGKISLYIYNRSTGNLEYREIASDKIWGNPLGWPSATILATKNSGYDAGNVSACTFGSQQVATFYAGDSANTGIYCLLK